MMFDNAVSYVHALLRTHLRGGDIVVDATAGNGWDAAVMASCIGTGTLYCFDVQQTALDVTAVRLRGLPVDARLVLAGHETMRDHVDAPHRGHVRAVTFNLGYLPGGDKEITTMADTTRAALDAALSLLADDGVLTVVCYRHQEGERELDMCRAMFSSWEQGTVTCIETSFINQQGKPPVVFVAAKKPAGPMRLDQR